MTTLAQTAANALIDSCRTGALGKRPLSKDRFNPEERY
jgi:hypothetical protein